MTRLLTTLVLSVLVSAPLARPGSVIGQDRLTEEIHDLVERFVDAWDDDDVEALSALFTEDGTFITPSGSRATFRQNIRRLLMTEHEDVFEGTTMTETITSIEFQHAGRAVVKGDYMLNGYKVLGFMPVSPHGSFTLHVIDNDDGWMIQRASISR